MTDQRLVAATDGNGLRYDHAVTGVKLDESDTSGIPFTLAGLLVDVNGRVLSESGEPIQGTQAAGEVGDVLSSNQPRRTGLVAGSMFGRRTGRTAALDIRALEVNSRRVPAAS